LELLVQCIGLSLVFVLVSGVFALRWIMKRSSRSTLEARGFRALVIAWLGIFGCYAYAQFLEADWLQISRVTLETNKIPKGISYRVAHFSDLHVDTDSRAMESLKLALQNEKPDLIVFTGDSLNSIEGLKLFHSVFTHYAPRLGRFAVKGNHDVWKWNSVELFEHGIAKELIYDAPILLDGRLALCGGPYGETENIEPCLKAASSESFKIFAYHTPDLVESFQSKPDLYLAGHTHGGQVRVPFFGALVTFSRFFKKYEMGSYRVGEIFLYVSRGLGFEPVWPKVRFLARPELVIIEIVGTK
jgi:uncharacterized protein